MYFKIIDIGDQADERQKYKNMGMVEITAAFYLEPDDEGYDKYLVDHQVNIPLIPEGEKYQGRVNEYGEPENVGDYQRWLDSFPQQKQLNPFCNHSIQFEPNVTEEEILWCFEWALAITQQNYLKNDLRCKTDGQVVNQPINYSARRAYYTALAILPDAARKPKEKGDYAKVTAAGDKIDQLKSVNLVSIKTAAKYRVK